MNGNITVLGQTISLLRKQIPAMVAQQIVGVQPMSMNQARLFKIQNPPKYKFSRAKWHEVSLMIKSYVPIQERIDWCEQMFGPQPKNPDAWTRWYTSYTTLRFRDEKDYVLFVLRWS